MKLSVITVCYNSEKYIDECINSVNLQTLNDVEHIFVDGGSSDKTLEIINKTSRRNKNLISEPDSGIYDAMNKGLRNAKGELICFLNSDDLYASKDVLEIVYDSFRNTKKQVIWGDAVIVNRDRIDKKLRKTKRKKIDKKDILVGNAPPHPSFFTSKAILDSIGNYNLKYKVASDFDLMKRALEEVNYDGLYIDKLTTIMRFGGISNSDLATTVKGNLEIIDSLSNTHKEFNILKFIFFKSIKFFRESFLSK